MSVGHPSMCIIRMKKTWTTNIKSLNENLKEIFKKIYQERKSLQLQMSVGHFLMYIIINKKT